MLTSVSFFDDNDNKLNYSGQKCEKIPKIFVTLYGLKTDSLNLSYNGLISLEGLEGFPFLKELILDNNHLSDTLTFPYLQNLQTLSLNNNNLSDLGSLIKNIKVNLPNITYLSLLGNKACPNKLSGEENSDEDYQRYRYYVLFHISNLKFLDSKKINHFERIEAIRRGKYLNIIRPKNRNETETILDHFRSSSFTPLPTRVRSPEDLKGAYGKCRYRYSGKHSEGNRFIVNTDL